MTSKQRIHLMADLWPAAAEAQGWPKESREARLQAIEAALGRTVNSANEIATESDYTRVKNHLLRLANSLHETDPAATRRHKLNDQLKCLALYPLDSPRGQLGAQHYLRTLIERLAHRAGYEPGPFQVAPIQALIQALERPALDRLIMTLDSRLNGTSGMRNQANHTIHDMRLAAGLPCHCKKCHRSGPPSDQSDKSDKSDDNNPF